ncbi:MAG: hypothetical protein K2L67_02425 [Clostridia bacterium]|nr:hypothetical protein [Clostridia bacterium]
MEVILKSIKDAEMKAAEIKAEAQNECAVIAADAEKKAAEILKTSEERLKLFKEQSLANAVKNAQDDYENKIKQAEADAKAYADGVIKNTDKEVNDIVGRVLSGNG